MRRAFAFIAVLLAWGAAGATTTTTFEAGGNWTGEAHFDQQSGAFAFCAVTADYENDVQLGFVMGPDFAFAVSLYSASWGLQQGSKFEVNLTVDRRWSRTLEAEAIDTTAVVVWIGNDPTGFESLRRGYTLSIAAARESFSFELAGSSRALAQASRCVLANSGGSGNPFASASAGATGGSASDQVAGFLLASGVESAVMMTPEEARGIWGEDHVGWHVGEGYGAIFNDPLNGQTPEAFVSGVIATLGSDCKDEFASGYKPAPASSLRRFFSACRTSGYTLNTLGVSMFFDDGDVMTIIHISDDRSLPAISQADDRVVDGLIKWGAR